MAGNKIVVASINARGLNNTQKRLSLLHWIETSNIDISIVQESFCTKDFGSVFNRQWKGQAYHSYTDSKHARGVCILIRKDFVCNVRSYCNNKHGRKLMLNIEYDDSMYTIVNLFLKKL